MWQAQHIGRFTAASTSIGTPLESYCCKVADRQASYKVLSLDHHENPWLGALG